MKISELPNLKLFLSILFKFFKENQIESSLQPINDYNLLLSRILDSELISYSCHPNIEYYGINFKLEKKIDESEIYMLIFGNRKSDKSCFLLIDIGEKDLTSFFTFSWHQEKLPPFMADFENDGADQIMTLEDFRIFLEANKEQKNLTWINVD